MDAIDESLSLSESNPDSRIAHKTHRVTNAACRMRTFLHLIFPAGLAW